MDVGEWVVSGANGAHFVTTSTVVPLGRDAGAVAAAARVDGQLVVAGAEGLFVWQRDALRPSPLADRGRLQGIRRMER